MGSVVFWEWLLESFYILVGVLLIACGIIIFKDKTNKTRFGGAAFWFIVGFIFITGKSLSGLVIQTTTADGAPAVLHLGYLIVGLLIFVLGVLSAFKQVNAGHIEVIAESIRQANSKKLGNKIFIPSIILAISAFIIAQFLPMIMPAKQQALGGQIAIGLSALLGIIAVLVLTKTKFINVINDGSRIVRQMGATSILPQLLSTLGVIFTAAGVGNLIGGMLSGIIPEGNLLIGIIFYCIGMALFTIIMGNAFAAFAVITVGIGIPFVIMQGGNPAIVGALGLSAGYCGTLLTPMAANFNIIPASLLETKTQYTVIKYQAPVALAMLVTHIVLMYVLVLIF